MMDDSEEVLPLFPIACEVEAGKTYYWCSCGKSKSQPFCNRSDCGALAVPFEADLTETVYFCSCKQTKTPPFCDGSHAKLLLERLKKRK